MKKTLLIILLFPVFASAIGSNGTTQGISVRPSGSDCKGPAYYWAGSLNEPPLSGLRITFYTLKGKQLGNTIDVWNQKWVYLPKNSSSGTYGRAVCETSTTSKRFYKCTAFSATYINKTPSRIDYINTNRGDYTINNDSTIRPITADYVYYVDENFDSKKDYNPLWYTRDYAYQQEAFRSYFTSPAIVKEYMKIAGVKNVDPYTSSDYLFVIEPVVKAESCGTIRGIGTAVLSTADFAFFLYESPVSYGRYNNTTLNCLLPKTLRIVEEGEHSKIGNVTFKLPKLPQTCGDSNNNFSWQDRTINHVGIGMYLIYGDQVSRKYLGELNAIVYHTINLNQPFLTIYGDTRVLDVDSNWYQKESTIETDVYKKNPKYIVVLTPTVMKQIRVENRNINYSQISSSTFEKFKKTYASIFK